MKSPLKVAKAAVKAAADELGISYKKAIRILYDDTDDDFDPDKRIEVKSEGPTTMARAVLQSIINNPSYARVPQYVFSIKQLNREDQAYIVANIGQVGYAISNAILAELKK